MSTPIDRFVCCWGCGHTISFLECKQLIADVRCPICYKPNTFGPGIYVPEFEGYTMDSIHRQRRDRGFPLSAEELDKRRQRHLKEKPDERH